MKSKLYYPVVIALSLVCFLGCRPSAREAATELIKISPGISRSEFYEKLLQAYPGNREIERLSQSSPQPLAHVVMETTEKLIQGSKERSEFVVIYPQDLFERDVPAYFEAVGLAAESAHGNGGVDLYYDAHTNYIGFMASSIEKVGSKK